MTKELTKSTIIDLYSTYDKKYGTWGWCSLDKAGCFIDCVDELCTNFENPICVEIGVYGGKSILPVALELQRHGKGIVHAIDPWDNKHATQGYSGSNYTFWSSIDLNYYYNFFLNLLKDFNIQKYVNVIKTTSNDAPEIKNIHLLYIDGQHTEQAILDAKKYASQIVDGGYCIVDDVNWAEGNYVAKVPDLLLEMGFEKIRYVDQAIIFKKSNVFHPSINYKNSIWIVDNFYEDPHKVRQFALQQNFDEGGIGRGYIGRRTYKQFLFPGLKERFETIMGQKIVKWEEHGMNGRFQVAWAGEPLVYHCDNQKWAGMIYLTPDAPFQCGTTLYANKKTRARTYYEPGWDHAWIDIPGDPHLDKTPFEPVDVMGNVFNRLAIFDASCIHSASEYFGTVKENSRLWQMFFFD